MAEDIALDQVADDDKPEEDDEKQSLFDENGELKANKDGKEQMKVDPNALRRQMEIKKKQGGKRMAGANQTEKAYDKIVMKHSDGEYESDKLFDYDENSEGQ